jgi:hypothetical protein
MPAGRYGADITAIRERVRQKTEKGPHADGTAGLPGACLPGACLPGA